MWIEGDKNIIWIAHFWLIFHIDKTITNFQQSTVIAAFEIRLSPFSRESQVVCFCHVEAKAICLTVT